jgi:predicted amidohydrolase
MSTIKVAACQMKVEVGNVEANLAQAEHLIEEGFRKGARWVLVPEFFTTGMAYHPSVRNGALPFDGPARELLTGVAKRHSGYVGGSFLSIKGTDRYNTYVLARPDGSYGIHHKDIPTWWENCYYVGCKDEGVIETEVGIVGAAMCWEFLRSRTVGRLKDKIDLLVGGSCWWGMPDAPIFKALVDNIEAREINIMKESFVRMARILGVPVAVANHTGTFVGNTPLLPIAYRSFYQGETQIINAEGRILARMAREDGMGVITAEIEPGRRPPSEAPGRGYWLGVRPWPLRALWDVSFRILNLHGKLNYKLMKMKDGYR